MKSFIIRFFERTEVMLALSIILPLLFAVDVSGLKVGIELGLGVVMYFSMRPFMGQKFHFQKNLKAMVSLILVNYVLLSGVYVLLGLVFFGVSHDFFTGFILIALVPPAVSIIPFCYLSKCDSETADVPVFISFVLSLFIIPVTLFLLFGKTVDFQALARILVIIILVPMYLAYRTYRSDSRLFDYEKALTNICLGIVIFISMSINRGVFFDFAADGVLYVYLVSFLAIFGTGLAVYFISRRLAPGSAVAYSFYASQKNVGTAITLGIFLFNPDTAVPAIIALAMQFIYFILFEELFVKRRTEHKQKN
ncbi:MAG: hypothetical protein KKD17_00230 [Nanoarchaeota archaeon]|nr:hypothetical protein [Nanoarchaeota archaeon]